MLIPNLPRVATALALVACGGSDGADPDAGPGADASPTRLEWFSDWRSGTGNAMAALYDGTKWNNQLCDADVLAVVDATGLDLPTATALRVEYTNDMECLMLQATERWRLVEVGEYMFLRAYYRNEIPDGDMLGVPHPLHIGGGGPGGYRLWFNFLGSSGGVAPMIVNMDTASVYPDQFWSFPFQTGATYRLELRMHRTTETTAKLALRVFDGAGPPVADEDDWHNGEAGPNSRTLAESDPTINVSDAGFQLLELGNNGPAGIVAGADRHVFWAGLAVAIGGDPDGWIGSYPTVTEAP